MTETVTDTGTQSAVRYDKDADGIVVLTIDDPTASANTMNQLYVESMKAAVDRLYAEVDDITGVVIASAKKTFFAGGNLDDMSKATKENAADIFAMAEGLKADLRRLETFPKPVAAAINGAALGGGLEIALATNHRVAYDHPSVQIGLPEASLGLLPGGGGVTRTVRMLGIQDALMNVLLQGPRYRPADAKAKGLVDELVGSLDELVPAAKKWVLDHKDDADAALNPWDRAGYRMPGGLPSNPKLAMFLPAFPALLRKQLKGADYPAQKAILSAAIEGAQVDFETASRIESRYLTNLIVNQNSKNMIQAFFFDLQAINSGSLRPDGIEKYTPTKVGVLGAGMMGAGIAYVCAKAGMEIVLKDVSAENAEKGKAYSEALLDKAISRGKSTEEKKAALLAKIKPTADPADFAGVDLVIEAVFEKAELKHQVFGEIAAHVNPDALLCSNTSSLPITGLAEGIDRPKDFIGLHFFSPVDKMPLVEIIRGKETSDEALAKAYDVVLAIKKTPIVVNDSRGFYTSRVIGTTINEGLRLLTEGVAPMSIERAAAQDGYPVGPLQISDELNFQTMKNIRLASQEALQAEGKELPADPANDVIDSMIEDGRVGKWMGKGFYEYVDGKRAGLWPGLAAQYPVAAQDDQVPFGDVKDRLMFVEAIETAKCFEEEVITSAAAANIGSIMGIGFPANTGGAAQFMTGYVGKDGEVGLGAFIKRAEELAEKYGERFAPTQYLRDLAAKGETFPA
ncbi:3-hydroxyacyl-CoA dehydrogenase NAD-binding domain-containing protein [Nocardioides speluncae]|uniref:3-hydroxyacyl-CoA dehydrogenase NAD-binding domain-containing protein n=1 Tax=Nocardioides speluncae TaxID=2670337 RepID=UPI001F0BCFFF|nr:3-hydroxyacyl-CoA dehydrogenase NAD-binding domain-containing protein [Nocardioides speluncae]